MIRTMWKTILAFFNKKDISDDTQQEENELYTNNYEDIRSINFTSIFANRLANKTISDSNFDVTGNNARVIQFQNVLKKLKQKLKKIISRQLGTGGVLVVPFVSNNKIYFNIVSQDRLKINGIVGEDIYDCTILASHIVRNQKNYYRWTDYTLKDNNIYIRHRATLENSPIDMKEISEWANIEDAAITNVDRMLFMYLKCPTDNKRESDEYGVPVTYGADYSIKKILNDLNEIDREFDLKKCFIGADSTLFSGDTKLPANGLFKKINSGEEDFWEIFDPAYRSEPLFKKLDKDLALLEKTIGTDRGILTDAETSNATATQIKKSQKNTFDLVDDIRDTLTNGLNDFFYACDVLSNYYNLSPIGEYELKCDYSYSELEDSQQEFNQLIQGKNQGVIKKEELRQFLKPEETLEEARLVIEQIKSEEPTTKDLLGE